MKDRICRYCTQNFSPSRYHPDEQICSSAECQRRRRADYHRKKVFEDPAYREQCLDSQVAKMEKEMEVLQCDLRLIEESHGNQILNLVLARG